MTSTMVVSRVSSFKPTRVKPHRVAPLDWVLMVPGIPWFTRRSIRLAFDMINSQVVALEDQSNTYTETRFLTTRAGFSGEVTLFLVRISGEVPSMVSLWKVEK